MHNALFARMASRVTTPSRAARDFAARAAVALFAAGALTACADEMPVQPKTPAQPKAQIPESGLKPGLLVGWGVDILPPGTTFTKPIAYVTGSPNGKKAFVQVYDKDGTQMARFNAFADTWDLGGVEVALGDVNGDGWPDIIAGEGPAQFMPTGSKFSLYDGKTGKWIFGIATSSTYKGGLRVGAGDVDGDGRDEVLTCFGPATEPTRMDVLYLGTNNGIGYKVHSTTLGTVTGKNSYNGCRVTGGDLDGDGKDEIITAFEGPANTLAVSKYTGGWDLTSFVRPNALGAGYTGGLSVAAADVNKDKKAEIFLGRLTGSDNMPPVFMYDGAKVMTGVSLPTPSIFYPIKNSTYNTGVYVAAHDLSGDGVPELLAKMSTTGFYSSYVAWTGPTFTSIWRNTFEPPGTLPGGGPIG